MRFEFWLCHVCFYVALRLYKCVLYGGLGGEDADSSQHARYWLSHTFSSAAFAHSLATFNLEISSQTRTNFSEMIFIVPVVALLLLVAQRTAGTYCLAGRERSYLVLTRLRMQDVWMGSREITETRSRPFRATLTGRRLSITTTTTTIPMILSAFSLLRLLNIYY